MYINMSKNCYIDCSPDSNFPIQNLPYGVFSTADQPCPRIGVAIGDRVLDLKNSDYVFPSNHLYKIFQQESLNDLMFAGHSDWKEARRSIQTYLEKENARSVSDYSVFVKRSEARMHMPVKIGDYTDFFASLYHAQNCNKLFKQEIFGNNWRNLPLAYHGRSSSVVVSGTPVRRPRGQIMISPNDKTPTFSPTKRLDYELEVGVFLGGQLNDYGESLNIKDVEPFIFGFVLLNDWSARDIQAWEMAPLGPFLSKNFMTSISPWVVTMEALKPFLTDNVVQSPEPLNYLKHDDKFNFDINLEAHLKVGDQISKICKTNYKHIYWTAKQMLCHHSITGCKMNAGDLLGTGTVSGPTENALACLLESTYNGTKPLLLPNGKERTFLEDGDEVILTGFCQGDGYRIGFGSCAGKIQEAY